MNYNEKTVAQSTVEMTELVLPNDTNLLKNLLGGRLLHWIDIAGAMSATRHANRNVATVAIDSVEFRHPISMGDIVILRSKLIWVGRTSMKVLVDIFSENKFSGEMKQTNTALLTFVALDENAHPTPVPRLKLETDEEKKLFSDEEKKRNAKT